MAGCRPENVRLAVLIDSDNTTASLTTELLEEIAKYGDADGQARLRRLDDPAPGRLEGALLRDAIQPMQQFAYTTGKNSTDSALIIDAMDLLYAGNVDGFVIVSSDSDFTRLRRGCGSPARPSTARATQDARRPWSRPATGSSTSRCSARDSATDARPSAPPSPTTTRCRAAPRPPREPGPRRSTHVAG